ncbi:unnamed protein product [Adineta ricciae]|uniref:Inhibitor of growth protein n=1 Tax=Adineta ricciae TaxID=249248 RepID=A0A814YGL1_ADIRI|nr:unnamed protein product [Adineta ricciae]
MHYLNDYLELLEPLREIMREKLTLMREKDLKLQVDCTQLEDDSSEFLNSYRLYQKQSSLSPTKSKIQTCPSSSETNDQTSELTPEQLAAQQQKQAEYNKLVDRHQQLLRMTEAKIALANDSHEFVERYFKKLENDLHKFKMELEADYSGLTEILEKRFANEACNDYEEKFNENAVLDPSLLDTELLFDPFDDLTLPKSLADDYNDQLSLNYLSSLNRKAQQRLQSSNSSVSSRGRKRLQSASSTNPTDKRKRTTLNDSQHFHPSDADELSINPYAHLKSSSFDDETYVDVDSTQALLNLNEQTAATAVTTDERRYCFCNQISYGDMIACDNSTCRREWFHYSCVGIVTPPKGKWFCFDCTQTLQQQQNIHK